MVAVIKGKQHMKISAETEMRVAKPNLSPVCEDRCPPHRCGALRTQALLRVSGPNSLVDRIIEAFGPRELSKELL